MRAQVSKKSRIYLRACFALLALWAAVALALGGLEWRRPSERKTLQFLEDHRLAPELPPDQRKSWITQLAAQLNALESDDRQRVLMDARIRPAITEMTDGEKSFFLQLTLPKGMAETMEGFDTALPERRLRWVNQALNELEQLQVGDRSEFPKQFDEAAARRIAENGLQEYWRDADPSTRIALQPLIERIQGILQVPR